MASPTPASSSPVLTYDAYTASSPPISPRSSPAMSPILDAADDDSLLTSSDTASEESVAVEALLLPPAASPSAVEARWEASSRQRGEGTRGFVIRALALLCACSLSIGSHYGSYFLGPLKSRITRELGASNAQFSLLLAAFSLNSTWTPLVGGLLASRLGTARSSILATSLILFGQLILLAGDRFGDVRLMACGMFAFGLGISPLAVVQETIIVRFFATRGLGVSLALGLVAGKGASFVAARSSVPLAERFGPHAPFTISAGLAAFSWCANLAYVCAGRWLAQGAGVADDDGGTELPARGGARMTDAAARARVAAKRAVRLHDVTRLGDAFWAYMAINVLCGAIWSPFTHLAANIVEQRYGLSERAAADAASLLLAGSIVLYPLCGWLTDRVKRAGIVHALFATSAALTLACYAWLVLPPSWTRTPTPAMAAFGTGHGFSTLLLVIIVPHIVPLRYVSTALGAHKSIEQAGSTISQTLAGLALDAKAPKAEVLSGGGGGGIKGRADPAALQLVLTAFFLVNVAQFGGTLGLWALDARRKRRRAAALLRREAAPARRTRSEADAGADAHVRETEPLVAHADKAQMRASWAALAHVRDASRYLLAPALAEADDAPGLVRGRAERARGTLFAAASAAVVALAWALFMGVAAVKLRDRA